MQVINNDCFNVVYNENCIDTLKRLDNNSIDLVITSPPYNMNLIIKNGQYCSRQIVKEFSMYVHCRYIIKGLLV